MQRYLESHIASHFAKHRQMLLVSGPRQVGKTTLARALVRPERGDVYLNWDNVSQRELLVAGPDRLASVLGLDRLKAEAPLLVLDEIHKYRGWRGLLKGFFDTFGDRARVLVTGSAALDAFRRGGDSLMGRYFPYTLHPLTVAELAHGAAGAGLTRTPAAIDDAQWSALLAYGGFPEPYLQADRRFYNRWRQLRTAQLLREDLRDLTRIQELDQVELLAGLLRRQVGQLTSFSSLARGARVSVDTVRRWMVTLEALYFCFRVPPWHRNVGRALRKEPKYYLWDFTLAADKGALAENLIASALLKAVHWWTHSGEGQFGLHFVRDKEKHEVDFLVTRDDEPWLLVEAKSGEAADLSPSLRRFQRQTGAQHAFQVAVDADYVDIDCFSRTEPTIVPARTFLSQLV